MIAIYAYFSFLRDRSQRKTILLIHFFRNTVQLSNGIILFYVHNIII